MKNHKKATKLDKNWLTHLTVVEKLGPVSYRVRHQLTGTETRAHADSLVLADTTWQAPKPTSALRRARMVVSPPDSASSSSEDPTTEEEDNGPPDRLLEDHDSDETVIYNPHEWTQRGVEREKKLREDTESEDDIPPFELRRSTRIQKKKQSSNENITDTTSSDMDINAVHAEHVNQKTEKRKHLAQLVDAISHLL